LRHVDVSPQAERELVAVLVYSATEFGLAAALRYQILIDQAFADLAENPTRIGVGTRDDVPAGFWLYPIRYSRDHVARDDRVKSASHVVVFRFDDQQVEILRLLHDAMDVPSRLS
jgi:toxin ParE1/3/4